MNAAAIPAALRERAQWVVWKNERRGGKWTKVPYRPADGGRTKASVTDPRTWGTFEQAMAVPAAAVQGIGYVFSAEDPFTGADLDACVDRATGELHPAAGELLERLGGYQERSPSGAGMHAIVEAELRRDRHKTGDTPWGGIFEVYDRERFFTVTGDGAGAIAARQAELDDLVARMFTEASQNGARPAGDASSGDAQPVLDRHSDLARMVARKGTKPGDGSASAWDWAMCSRAAELGYDDGVLAVLLRHSRRVHGEPKGDRDDYIATTIRNVRRRVGHVGAGASPETILDELTKAIRVNELGRRVVSTHVGGHGSNAGASIMLDDGYTIEFDSFGQVAQSAALADQLATTVGITTDFNRIQARRVAALVRLAASRADELRDYSVYVDAALRLLALAEAIDFDLVNQADRWLAWSRVDSIDPAEIPEPPELETEAQRRKRESRTAETYARRVVIPVDRATGVQFVRTGWLQEFMRLTLGSSSTPTRARKAMLRAGWKVRGKNGRIKATNPINGDDELPIGFYLVPRDWRDRQAGDTG